MTPFPDLIEAARLTRFPTSWESRFDRYEQLVQNAGHSEAEACRIVTAAMLDEFAELARAPALTRQEGIAA